MLCREMIQTFLSKDQPASMIQMPFLNKERQVFKSSIEVSNIMGFSFLDFGFGFGNGITRKETFRRMFVVVLFKTFDVTTKTVFDFFCVWIRVVSEFPAGIASSDTKFGKIFFDTSWLILLIRIIQSDCLFYNEYKTVL